MGLRVVLGCLFVLAYMALVVIIFGQRQAEVKILERKVLWNQTGAIYTQRIKDMETMHQLIQQVHEKQKKAGEELEAEVNELVPEAEKKKSDSEVCQAEKKGKTKELEPIQREQTDTGATFKAEIEAWTEEMTKLKEQIVQPSKLCEFVKKDMVLVKALCAAQTETVTLVV